MNRVIQVHGVKCLIEGDWVTVYIDKRVHEKKPLTKDDAMVKVLHHLKAARVWQYLIDEGFVSGKNRPLIRALY